MTRMRNRRCDTIFANLCLVPSGLRASLFEDLSVSGVLPTITFRYKRLNRPAEKNLRVATKQILHPQIGQEYCPFTIDYQHPLGAESTTRRNKSSARLSCMENP